MQLLRNLHLAWRVLYASISTILCCEVFASLCYKGKVTPAKVRRHESRQELIDVLKPHAIRVGKALLALKKARSAADDTGNEEGEDAEEEQDEEAVNEQDEEAVNEQDEEAANEQDEEAANEQDEEADEDASMLMIKQMGEDAGLEALKAKLMTKVKPTVEARGLPWGAVEGQIEEIDSIAEVKAAINDPEAFLKRAVFALGRDVLLEKLKKKLQPMVESRGLPWPIVEELLENIDSQEEVESMAEDPEAFLRMVADGGIQLMVFKVGTMLRPMVERRGLPWALLETLILELDTIEKLEAVAADPEALLAKAKALAFAAVMEKVKAVLTPIIQKRGLPADPIITMLDELDTLPELEAVAANPEVFLEMAKAVVFTAFIDKAKEAVRPMAEKRGLPWEAVEPLLDEVDEVAELQAVIADPSEFLTKAADAALAVLIDKAKVKLKPICEKNSVPWDVVQLLLDDFDTIDELTAAVAAPDALLMKAKARALKPKSKPPRDSRRMQREGTERPGLKWLEKQVHAASDH